LNATWYEVSARGIAGSNPQRGFFLPDSFRQDQYICKAEDKRCYPAPEKGRINEDFKHNHDIIGVFEESVGTCANQPGPGKDHDPGVPEPPEAEDAPIPPDLK